VTLSAHIEIATVATAFAAGILFFTLGVCVLSALRGPVLGEERWGPYVIIEFSSTAPIGRMALPGAVLLFS
jgi:hypothetical protein